MAGNTSAWGRTNVWGNKSEEAVEPVVSFVDIMSEDLAQSLTEEEEKLVAGTSNQTQAASTPEVAMTDEEYARMLQREYDREFDISVTMEQQQQTPNTPGGKKGNSSFTLTPDRYYPKTAQESDDSDEDNDDEIRQLATDLLYAKLEKKTAVEQSGLSEEKGVTKHNPTLAARRNADKTLNDTVNLKTGDMISEEVSNRVFNTLRSFAKAETKRQHRLKDKEEKATMETSMDAKTRLELFKFINLGLIDSVEGIISTGKESAVLHAVLNENESTPDKKSHYAIKVYKTSLNEFKNRSEYVKDDFRFKNPRRVLKIWAEKEYMNLMRMHRFNLPCPVPVKLKRHLLVMSLIGDEEGDAAPRLKNVDWDFFTEEEIQDIYKQTESIMCRLFQDCQLVHGDLSEFNLLLCDGKVFVIDVSQAMDLSHPRNLHFLTRDIENVLNFFSRINAPTLPTAVALFNLITQLEMNEAEDLMLQVEAFSEENRTVDLRKNKSKPADMEWQIYNKEKVRGTSPGRDYN
ncbi:hypothetical protein WR25_23113 [Diploscapter pachys]|uniref:Serine/threonine-protein kinase RIO3 n=1 Tax=Diploscapter pachys TaxID=2018661 RepID=A0A2A2LR23_9BILA|nr:hypothetical protein WR25_23113 [Diploscapter pachys]